MKIDADTYRELYVGKLPQPVNRFSLSAAAGNGLYLSEQPYSGRPTETNRLWKFDAKGVWSGKLISADINRTCRGSNAVPIDEQPRWRCKRQRDPHQPDLSEYEIIRRVTKFCHCCPG